MRKTSLIWTASCASACSLLLTAQATLAETLYFASDIMASGASGVACASTQTRANETADLIKSFSGEQASKILTTEANNCYDSDSSYEAFQSNWWDRVPGYPILPAPGNHDYLDAQGRDNHTASAFKNKFGNNSTYFSQNIGNDWLVVVLDSELDDLTDHTMWDQIGWLETLLWQNYISPNRRPCILAVSHRPAYSNAKKHRNEHLDGTLVAFLQAYRTTLLLSGHEHVYERLAPQEGMIQIVAGTGGAALNSESGAFLNLGEPGYVPHAARDNTNHGILYVNLRDRDPEYGYDAGYFVLFSSSHSADPNNVFGDAVFGACNQD